MGPESRSLAAQTIPSRSRAEGVGMSGMSPSRTLSTAVSSPRSPCVATMPQQSRADAVDVDNPIYITQCYSSSAEQCQKFPATRESPRLSCPGRAVSDIQSKSPTSTSSMSPGPPLELSPTVPSPHSNAAPSARTSPLSIPA
jgi:hypothetical protein